MIRKYVFNNLKNLDEKFSRVVRILADFEFIRINASHEEIFALLPHIDESIKIVNASDLTNRSEFIAKLNVGKFLALADTDSPGNANMFAEKKILPRLEREHIDPKGLILLLNDIAYGYMRNGEFKKAKEVLGKCFKIYTQFSDESFVSLRGVSEAYLINVNTALGKSEHSIAEFRAILTRLNNSSNLISNTSKAIVCYQYYSFCIDNGVSPRDLRDLINIMEKFLKTIGVDKFYHENKDLEEKSLPFFVPGIRYRMAGIYNILEKYNKALENIKEVRFFYERRQKNGVLSMTLQSDLDL